MTPEEAQGKRATQVVIANPGAEVIFQAKGQPALLKISNDRGPIEVLVAADRVEDLMEVLQGPEPMTLTGFFRRRSGFRQDGSRHFIWCLVLFTAESLSDALPKAA